MSTPPPLRDPVADFVNRQTEKRAVKAFCEGRLAVEKRCLILRTTRDVGVTFFLRHLEQTADDRWFAVYADCGSSDPEVIFRKFFERLEDRKLLRWRALNVFREFGDVVIRVLAPLLLPGPWAVTVGPLAAAVVPKVGTTAYASTPSERFAKLITSGRWKRPVVFLVDNAQEIKPQSLHILNTVFSHAYDHVRFVLSFIADAEKRVPFEEFDSRLRAFGLGVETIDFPPPDEQFVAQIASALHVSLPPKQSGELLRKTNGSLSRIIGFLQSDRSDANKPSVLEQEILRYLIVAGQPLQRNDILQLVLKSPRLAGPETAVQQAIESLARKKLILRRSHWLGDEVEVAPGQARGVRQAVPSFSDLVAVQELYAYFTNVEEVRSPRHSQSAYGALLYKLAKQVDPAAVSKRAFELVRISLAQADIAAAGHYIEQAMGDSSSRSVADLYTLLAFHVSVQDFDRALSTLDELGPQYWMNVQILRIIHAISLNRVRAHSASGVEIDALLAEPATTAEEFALLTSYRVAGLLHEGELGRAREAFERAHSRLRLARNRGYALRNCAAVYFWGDGRDPARADALLAEATQVFEQQQDAFGVYTTLNNRGALAGSAQSGERSARSALPMFQRSFDALAVFGTQHLEEVGANLGTALLLTRQADQAVTHLRKISAIASFDFPQVLMESALAFAELMSGDTAGARDRVWRLTRHAADLKLPEAVYRANVNAAAVEAAARAEDGRFASYVEAARGAGFWAGTASLERVLAGVRESAVSRETLPDYLSYDYFQYWSQNPLAFLSAPILPEKAVRDHVAN
jgi:hypothetical protein